MPNAKSTQATLPSSSASLVSSPNAPQRKSKPETILVRKGWGDKEMVDKINRVKILPDNGAWIYGEAVIDPDSFYDAVAQSLNGISSNNATPYTVKFLRGVCSDYFLTIDRFSEEDNWVKRAIKAEDYLAHLEFVRYTREETVKQRDENIYYPKNAIEGKFAIEGRILAEKLNTTLHVIEFHESQVGVIKPTHWLVTSDGVQQYNGDNVIYREPKRVHLAVYGSHFVPILSAQNRLDTDLALFSMEHENDSKIGKQDALQSTDFTQSAPHDLTTSTSSPILVDVESKYEFKSKVIGIINGFKQSYAESNSSSTTNIQKTPDYKQPNLNSFTFSKELKNHLDILESCYYKNGSAVDIWMKLDKALESMPGWWSFRNPIRPLTLNLKSLLQDYSQKDLSAEDSKRMQYMEEVIGGLTIQGNNSRNQIKKLQNTLNEIGKKVRMLEGQITESHSHGMELPSANMEQTHNNDPKVLEENEQLRKENEELQKQTFVLKDQLKELVKINSDLKDENINLRRSIELLQFTCEKLERQLTEQSDKFEQASSHSKKLEEKLSVIQKENDENYKSIKDAFALFKSDKIKQQEDSDKKNDELAKQCAKFNVIIEEQKKEIAEQKKEVDMLKVQKNTPWPYTSMKQKSLFANDQGDYTSTPKLSLGSSHT